MSEINKINKGATASGFRLTSYILFASAVFLLAVVFFRHFLFRETPYLKAVSLIRSGKSSLALPILERLSIQHPDNANLFPWLAQAYLSNDRIAEGRVALDTALKMELPAADVIDAVKAYVTFYERRGDFEEAEKLLQSARNNCPLQLFNENRAKLYMDWAEANLDNDNSEQAIIHLDEVYKLRSDLRGSLRSLIYDRLAEGYRRASITYETTNDYQQASALLEKSLSVSDDPATRLSLAQLDVHLNKIEEAIRNYQIVSNADPNNLEARHGLIDLLIQSGDLDGAQEALIELANKEKSVENYQQLVDVSLKLKNYAGAVHALEDAYLLNNKPEQLEQLLTVLSDWEAELIQAHKLEEAASVKGHADRISEELAELLQNQANQNNNQLDKQGEHFATTKNLPVALISSRTWLSSGSLTPEGEIKIKNITGKPVRDLTLTAVFYDHTLRRTNGTVKLPVATPVSAPFAAGASRTLYFSCPDTVKIEHQLAVRLFWREYFLKEFPISKQP